jgi:hypothetical protein
MKGTESEPPPIATSAEKPPMPLHYNEHAEAPGNCRAGWA